MGAEESISPRHFIHIDGNISPRLFLKASSWPATEHTRFKTYGELERQTGASKGCIYIKLGRV
jgi:hypothetical protein